MTSPNLAITHVAASQNQKEVTVNDAIDALDRAMTEVLAVSFAAGPVTLTAMQFRTAAVFMPSAALTTAANLNVPQQKRGFTVVNTDASYSINVIRGTTSLAVRPGRSMAFYTDGTTNGLYRLGPPDQAVYDFGMLQTAVPTPGAVMGKVVLPRALTLPANFSGSRGHVDTPPTAVSWVASVTRNGSAIGTVSINSGGGFTFATTGGAAVAVSAGDVIRFLADPTSSPAEAAIAGIAITLAAEVN